MNNIQIGSIVKFYDCNRAFRDKNFSGTEEYYSKGVVVDRYLKEYKYNGYIHGYDLCDIRCSDDFISFGHFTDGLTLID